MNIKDILITSQVKGIGPAFFKKNMTKLKSVDLFNCLMSCNKQEEVNNIKQYSDIAESILSDCEHLDVTPISVLSEKYPKQLLDISNPPSVIYVKGNMDLLDNVIAIIGTRHSTTLGNTIAERLGEYFSTDFSICNGLVEGIDEHSVYFNGCNITGKAIGIISGGMNYKVTCSAKHAKMIDDVLNAGGLIISEFPPQQKEDKFSGSKASRIQAGLAHGMILVQSSLDGGSKYTLATFSKLPRTLGVIHYPQSKEYYEDLFEANRVIVEKNKSGLASILNLKSDKSIALSSIMPITGKSDYDTFKSKVFISKQRCFNDLNNSILL